MLRELPSPHLLRRGIFSAAPLSQSLLSFMSPKKPTYTVMTDKQRISLVKQKQNEPRMTHVNLISSAEKHLHMKVSQSTISKTLARSAELLAKGDNVTDVKRQKFLKYPLMEEPLYEWFIAYQTQVNVSGELLKAQGAKFLNELYPEADGFEFSNGWLEKFKTRYGIKSFRRFGESGSVDMSVVDQALPRLCELLDPLPWGDIYNMDETRVFFRMLADNSLATKQLEGRKAQKEWITLAVCYNDDGSDKLPLWIIGKFQNPRCFKNLNRENLGCSYRWNLKAWMTQVIFLEWIKWFDLRMADMKVLLILDNCSAHIPDDSLPELRNTTVRYLPPNTTLKIQPCGAGIIRNLKAYYRCRFNDKILLRLDSNIPNPKKIDILEGIKMAVAAWTSDVKPETISNCFHHCQIRSEDTRLPPVTEDMVEPAAEVISELESQIRRFRIENPMNIRNLLNYRDEEIVMYTPTEEEIVANLKDPAVEIPGPEEEDDSEELSKIRPDDAISMLEKLQHFWLQQEGVHTKNLLSIRSMMAAARKIRTQKLKQTTLDSFFHQEIGHR